jgi:hypothetical protein
VKWESTQQAGTTKGGEGDEAQQSHSDGARDGSARRRGGRDRERGDRLVLERHVVLEHDHDDDDHAVDDHNAVRAVERLGQLALSEHVNSRPGCGPPAARNPGAPRFADVV